MCGIFGFKIKKTIETETCLKKAIEYLSHRGPDDNGFFLDEFVAFAHTRLSIQDLSKNASQPFKSSCGNYTIILNGEIYNFREIYETLAKKYNFISTSDTEVALYAMIENGFEKALRLFNGMFSIAFYDKRQSKLYLARDRVGVKPLYVYATEQDFVFSSEIKAFFCYQDIKPVVDLEQVSRFLQFGYIPSPYSIYKNIRKVMPGHYIEYDFKTNQYRENPYWKIKFFEASNQTYDQIVDRVEELIQESIQLRLIADVPVGSFLSGGIDSSLMTAMMKEQRNNINTFTISFNESEFDESQKALRVAKFLGTQHYEFTCDIKKAQQIIEEIPDIMDEPFGDSSIIPVYLLAKETKKVNKVVLSGDGGDELFGGYDKYFQYAAMEKILKVPRSIRYFFQSCLKLPYKLLKNERFDKIEMLLKAHNFQDVFFAASKAIQGGRVTHMFKDELNPVIDRETVSMNDFGNDFMAHDIAYFLEGDILTKGDRATMASGLEGREPLLDYKLLEYAMSIPSKVKYKYGQKSILKSIALRYIPEDIVNMPKQGFNVPVTLWLKGDLRDCLDHYLSEHFLKKTPFFNTQYILSLKENFLYNNGHVYPIWYLLSFLMWFEKNQSKILSVE